MSGTGQIARFNAPYYVASLCVVGGIGAAVKFMLLPRVLDGVLIFAAGVALFWTAGSLLVSCYVYDYAAVTQWEWLPEVMRDRPKKWLNIHAGLDQSTTALKRLFPGSESQAVDIYDPNEMTEGSIGRARRIYGPADHSTRSALDTLPAADASQDMVFVLFAAHEIRHRDRRVVFLRECARVLKPGGTILLVEHPRDWKNFAAFGPGFLHFHSRREWLRAVEAAGLRLNREAQITPFVMWFLFRRSEA